MDAAAAGEIAMIDPVVRAAMTPAELDELLERIRPSSEAVLHCMASVGGHDMGVLSAFNMREHGGVRFLGANGLYLAPGLIYTSGSTTQATFGPAHPGLSLHSTASLKVTGRRFPHIVVAALAGRHVSALVEHPALADPRLLIENASYERYTVVKARGGAKAPPGDPVDSPIAVLLPQLLEPLP